MSDIIAMMANPAILVVLLVIIQRLIELVIAHYNTKNLLAEGAIEYGAEHYKYFIILHGSWLVICLYYALGNPNITDNLSLIFLLLFLMMQLGRVWVLHSLGKYWTTRIITPPNVALVKKGPYKFVSHPNYIVVACELFLLPAMLGEWWLAIAASICNIPLTWHRITIENSSFKQRPH